MELGKTLHFRRGPVEALGNSQRGNSLGREAKRKRFGAEGGIVLKGIAQVNDDMGNPFLIPTE